MFVVSNVTVSLNLIQDVMTLFLFQPVLSFSFFFYFLLWSVKEEKNNIHHEKWTITNLKNTTIPIRVNKLMNLFLFLIYYRQQWFKYMHEETFSRLLLQYLQSPPCLDIIWQWSSILAFFFTKFLILNKHLVQMQI